MSSGSGSPAAGLEDEGIDSSKPTNTHADELSDNDSELSDVDEAQFEGFDASALALDREEPVIVDEETVKLLGRHKRKRPEGDAAPAEGDAGKKKKKKEGRREKQRQQLRPKKATDDDDLGDGEYGLAETTPRKSASRKRDADAAPKRKAPVVENEENLDPEERRRRALDRAMDAALRKPNASRRRKHGDIDLTQSMDEEIADLRVRMADAAAADVDARSSDPPRPAMHKLKLLAEVVALLNRNGREVENAIVDPENNILESVRFFLEPLRDGSLPAYNIQRELFAALIKLPIDKESLLSSGLGKVVVFYTKAKKVELPIKRQAERLLAEWTRPILKRSDDYRTRHLEKRVYDPIAADAANRKARRQQGMATQEETPEQRRARQLAVPDRSNRARVDDTTKKSYTIAPQSSMHVNHNPQFTQPMGAAGDAAFRRMRQRQLAASGKGPKRG